MNTSPRFFGTAIKILAALVISVLIITVIGGQNKQQSQITDRAFNMLRESLLTAIPNQPQSGTDAAGAGISDEDAQDEAGMIESTVISDNTEHVHSDESEAAPEAPVNPMITRAENSRKKLTELTDRSTSRELMPDKSEAKVKTGLYAKLPHDESKDEAVDLVKDRAVLESIRDTLVMTSKDIESLEMFAVPELAVGTMPFENFEVDMESISGLISQAIEISVNEFQINQHELEQMTSVLKDAEKHFDISDLDYEEIFSFTRKIALLNKMKEKMKKIAIEEGGKEDCDFHIPKLKINEDLEIVGYYQTYDCHPEIAANILERIKRLPEWRKLAKKQRIKK